MLDKAPISTRILEEPKKGNWHAITEDGMLLLDVAEKDIKVEKDIKNEYWVFVDLENTPRYWIVPDSVIRKNIHDAHQEYLKKHGGHRAVNDASNHHSIKEDRLNEWAEMWDILGIF